MEDVILPDAHGLTAAQHIVHIGILRVGVKGRIPGVAGDALRQLLRQFPGAPQLLYLKSPVQVRDPR